MEKEKDVVQKIVRKYQTKETTKLDELRQLDQKVKRPVKIFAYIFGGIGALILGTGMSLAMEVIGDSFILGIMIGCLGILLVSVNYFIYQKLMTSRKRKYSQKIIDASNELINSN